jgi:hypothetical protein
MNEAHDPIDSLEAELAALRPHDGSPELHSRLAECRAHASGARSRWVWRGVLVGGLAAASLVVTIHFGWVGGSRESMRPSTVQIPPAPQPISEDSQHAFGAYEFILARSSDELESLLNKAADGTSRPNLQGSPLSAYPRSEAEFDALLGAN